MSADAPPETTEEPAPPTVRLEGTDAAAYLRRWSRALYAARLSHRFPDGRMLGAAFDALGSAVECGARNGVEVDARTGLPTYAEWVALQADATLAADQLQALGDRETLARKADRRGRPADLRLLALHDHYANLDGLGRWRLDDVRVALRRHDPESETVHVKVTVDKHDVSGTFVRYTVLLAQRGSSWGRAMVAVDDREHVVESAALRSLVYRYASTDAEMTFIKLSERPDIRVEEVHRGTVGPAWGAPNRARAPRTLRPRLTDGWLATFGLQSAARTLVGERSNDPLRAERRGGPAPRPELAAIRDRLEYGTTHDRKLVCTPDLRAAIETWTTAHGTRNLIYDV